MIKRTAKYLLISLAFFILAVVSVILICVLDRPGYTKTEITYGEVDFLITSWGDWPHDTRYNWYRFDEGKKKLILKGTANGHPSVEFSFPCTTNDVYYANLFGDYFCIQKNEVTVFGWDDEELFIDYFHWILETQGFWECQSLADGMYNWWQDPKAQAFYERVLTEDPESDFFPMSPDDIWLRNYKQQLTEKLNKNPNQNIEPTRYDARI